MCMRSIYRFSNPLNRWGQSENKGQNTHINKLYKINQLFSFKVILNIRYMVLFNVLKRKIKKEKNASLYPIQ